MAKGKLTDTFRAFFKFVLLNFQQKRIIFSSKLDGSHTVDYWIDLLDDIGQYDELADNARDYARRVFFYWILGGLGLIFFNVVLENFLAKIFGSYAFFVLYFFTLIGFFFYLVYWIYARLNLENYIRIYVLPLLYILKEETEPTTPILLQLNLKARLSNSHIARRTQNFKMPLFQYRMIAYLPLIFILLSATLFYLILRYAHLSEDTMVVLVLGLIFGNVIFFIASFFFGPKYPRLFYTYYAYPALILQTTLLDGTTLKIISRDFIRKTRKVAQKTNARGKTKYKTKIKYKMKCKVSILLGIQKRDFTAKRNAPQNTQFSIEDKPRRTAFKVKKQIVFTEVESSLSLDTILLAMKEVYQKLEPVSQENK